MKRSLLGLSLLFWGILTFALPNTSFAENSCIPNLDAYKGTSLKVDKEAFQNFFNTAESFCKATKATKDWSAHKEELLETGWLKQVEALSSHLKNGQLAEAHKAKTSIENDIRAFKDTPKTPENKLYTLYNGKSNFGHNLHTALSALTLPKPKTTASPQPADLPDPPPPVTTAPNLLIICIIFFVLFIAIVAFTLYLHLRINKLEAESNADLTGTTLNRHSEDIKDNKEKIKNLELNRISHKTIGDLQSKVMKLNNEVHELILDLKDRDFSGSIEIDSAASTPITQPKVQNTLPKSESQTKSSYSQSVLPDPSLNHQASRTTSTSTPNPQEIRLEYLENPTQFIKEHSGIRIQVPSEIQIKLTSGSVDSFYLQKGGFHYVAIQKKTSTSKYFIYPKVQPYAKTNIASLGLDRVFEFHLPKQSGNIIVNFTPAVATLENDKWTITNKGALQFA